MGSAIDIRSHISCRQNTLYETVGGVFIADGDFPTGCR
jgi:hypothetical protein